MLADNLLRLFGRKLDAFRDAASYISAVFLVGLIALMFLPETRGRPLPED